MKGWIALDIDGTITDRPNHVPKEVVDYLHDLQSDGWEIMFVTGRMFSFAHLAIDFFNFPFYFAVQNGADIYHMPEKKLISRCYLSKEVLPTLEEIVPQHCDDFVIYAGPDNGDFCYFRPDRFPKVILEFFEKIKPLAQHDWIEVKSFSQVESFPLAKAFGTEEKMRELCAALQPVKELAVSMIRDPIKQNIYLTLINHHGATKGHAVERIISEKGERGVVIAAGDDRNDIPLLEVADISIAMSNAPEQLKQHAQIIAPPASELGIIQGIDQAIKAAAATS